MNARVSSAVAAILDAALRGELTETQAQQLYAYGPEAVTLVLLTITRHVAEQDAGIATREAADAGPSPSTPSGMVPVYAKPNATRRRRRPGARKGHPGTRRVQPTRIDRQEVHRLPRCPHCNGRLQRRRRVRSRLVEAIRLRQRADFAPGKYQSRVDRLNRRLARMAAAEPVDDDARRLTKRLRRYAEYLLTFLDYADVPYENNFAERQIRPAVIIRKNSLSNRSERGASMQAVLMSVYRTLKLRGLNPTRTIAAALRTYVATGKLPPLPDPAIAHG